MVLVREPVKMGRKVQCPGAPPTTEPNKGISLRVIRLPNTDLRHICGGSIINKQYVDTAAHCIQDGYKSPSNYIVVIGDQNLNVVDPYEQRIAVANITIHPQWDPPTLNYDYALLKLARPLNFTGSEKALMPICLPTPNQEFDGMTCTASGWGLTKDSRCFVFVRGWE
ncbi:chymotrypsin-like protease CTRL-1 [Ixodes scapularis]